jgi:hypothetical protein
MNADTKSKQRDSHLGKHPSVKTEFTREDQLGSKNNNWISDRSKVSGLRKYTTPEYKDWRKKVCERDNWKCQLDDGSCSKIIHAHHILRWSLWKDLRYKVSNGITLCKKHHPLKRSEEDRLASIFQEIINRKNA